MITNAVGATDIGRKRDHNEDAFVIDDDLGLYVVADGMGGHASGEVASALAAEVAQRIAKDERSLLVAVAAGDAPGAELRRVAVEMVQNASREIHGLATSRRERAGMGCTMTVLLVAGSQAAMAHAGDSRLYLLRSGRLHQLSTDHTYADELFGAGVIKREEIRTHPHAHVLTRAVGTHAAVVPDALLLDIFPGDRFLLCSDGLADYADDEAPVLQRLSLPDVEEIPDALVTFANDAGGHDNITVVAVEVSDDEEDTLPGEATLSAAALDALSSSNLFEGVRLAHLARVLAICDQRRMEAGEQLVAKGETADALVVVLSGELVHDDGDGVRLRPGAITGESVLLAPRPALHGLRAAEDSRVLLLKRDSFRKLTRARPRLGVSLLERLGARLSRRLEDAGT